MTVFTLTQILSKLTARFLQFFVNDEFGIRSGSHPTTMAGSAKEPQAGIESLLNLNIS